MSDRLTNEFLTYLTIKDQLSEKQKDEYVESLTKRVSKRIINMIQVLNNT